MWKYKRGTTPTPIFWRISALASKMGQIKKWINAHHHINANLVFDKWSAFYLFWIYPFYRLGQKSFKNLVRFLGDLKTPKFLSEINWPLKAIVNVSSIAGLRASPGSLAYKISKAAMDQLTRCSALELAPKAQYIHYDSKRLATL